MSHSSNQKQMFNISLIIPTYNEAKNIPFLIEEIFGVVDKSKINMFEETIDMLIRKGIIMVNPSQRGTISVNPRVNEIEDNLLKEYLSEALNNYK